MGADHSSSEGMMLQHAVTRFDPSHRRRHASTRVQVYAVCDRRAHFSVVSFDFRDGGVAHRGGQSLSGTVVLGPQSIRAESTCRTGDRHALRDIVAERSASKVTQRL